MSPYTDEELLAVARVVWPSAVFQLARSRQALLGQPVNYADDYLVRLALAHPERADEALGPGWEVMRGSTANGRAVFVWCASLDIGELELWVRDGGVALVVSDDQVFELPPEFDAALSRARLIAAAWQRIEAGSQRDPARPYCREPETCNGSCRRDPACNS